MKTMLTMAEAPVSFKLFDAPLVASIREGQGNLDTAKDLVALSALFNANWDNVENKVPFGLELVEQAGGIGANLLHAIGITEIGEVRKDAAYDWLSLRVRAFHLLVNEYDELRRAVMFIRWHHGDAHAFAPSLHTGVRKRPEEGGTANDDSEESELFGSEEPSLGFNTDAPIARNDIPEGFPGSHPFRD